MANNRNENAMSADGARFVVLTGLSGAGKSEAVHALEDLGYFCVDNLPTSLILSFADLSTNIRNDNESKLSHRSAVVVDVRDRRFLSDFPGVLKELRVRKNLGAVVIFLEASEEALVRRFSETRRPHPLAVDRSVLEGIIEERVRLEEIKRKADRVFDTSDLTVHELRQAFMELSRGGSKTLLMVTLLSFGYKHGVPLESDLLLDVRFLPNPHFVERLRAQTGQDVEVQRYVDESASAKTFLEKSTDLLRFLLPQYAGEGKSYLTIGVGCTGGRHRSVVVVDRLRRKLTGLEGVRLRVKHRDILVDQTR